MSLRTRLALLQAAVLAAGLALLGALLVAALEGTLVREVDQVLAARAASIADDLRALAANGLAGAELDQVRLDPSQDEEFAAPGVYVEVVGPDGTVVKASRSLAAGGLPGAAPALTDARVGRPRLETLGVPGGERLRVLTTPVVEDGRLVAAVRVGESLHQVDVVLRRLVGLLLTAGAVVLAVAVAATWLLVGRALAPLEQVALAAERIATTGDVTVQVPSAATGGGEIGRLGRSFNRMVERLRRLLESQRQLLADTSHELRNPLTVIRTNLDLLRQDVDPTTRQEVAAETDEEAERMSRLVGDLLFLGREQETVALELAPLQLDQLAAQLVERFRQIAPAHRILLARTEPIVVRGDAGRLRQLLDNLLDNAVRYTPPGGRVTIAVERDGSDARIVVEDSGVGIPPEHLPRIFDRFYRVDPARNRATGGTGLGLAIVKYVATAHGGRVSAESDVGRGSRFVVTLPAEPSWAADADAQLDGGRVQSPASGQADGLPLPQ